MAFGGSSSFFGNNNNQQQQSTGFGSTFGGNNNTGFGTNNTNTGFGSSTTGNNVFGGSSNAFGNTTSGFGSNNNTASPFGANKTTSSAFGGNTASTGGSIFGSTNNTTGGFGTGGFGSGNTTTGFGANNTSNSNMSFSFGNNANKPAFGSNSSSTPLFGQGGAGTTGGFGSSNTGFGSSGTGTALNQPVPPSDGTASTTFAPTTEKETNGTTNSYQSITFQQPYQKYSFDELRAADYNAGRRFGNGSGQAGAFGSTSFGGFGSTNTGNAFGNNTNSNPFGGTTATTNAFGTSNTSGFGNNTGGLFGNNANKPASSLFGTQPTTSAGTTGGLFGTSNNTTNAFGNSNTSAFGNNANTTGGLFANNQNKPAGTLFGNNTNNQTTGSSLFGNNQASTNTGGGLFGNNTANNTTGGLFGSNNQQSNTTGGLFANNQQKPGGLFGGGSNAFGTNTTQNQASGGLFGSANNTTNTGGGLFGGNNTNTSTGGGLFSSNTNNNTGGGLFGSNNQQSNTGGGLFGSNNQQTQNKPGGLFTNTNQGSGLFGSTNTNTANNSGGLFGNNNTNTSGSLFGNNATKPTTSLFGANTSTNQQSSGLFGNSGGGGLFNSSNNPQANQQQQDGVKHASLLDPNPYGQSSIWTGLPAASPENSKPVFTPLTASQKLKESMMKPAPSLRLNQSRYMTPPRRNGYGFTYSTYGTPNSAASTPGGVSLSGSMYGSRGWSGGSFGRSFNKSASVQNLRAQFSSDNDELWKPGAFASTGRHSSGSIKRLTIDRSIRNDLFSRPTQPALPAPPVDKPTDNKAAPEINGDAPADLSHKYKKRVSFDNSTTSSQLNGDTGALVRTESPENEEEQGSRPPNGDATSRVNELAMVPEDRESDHVITRSSEILSKADPKPGDYWMKPSRAEMAKLPRDSLQSFKDFQVGRRGCGQVTFNGTVDLTTLPLDDLYDKIVEIRLRSVTVYPDASSKPPVNKGLNVPSTIAIENSWPRSRNVPSSVTSGPVFDKHVNRLKKMNGTEFVDYEVDTGVWTFRVPHYTRYGLDYDEDEADLSELTPPPDSTIHSTLHESSMELDDDVGEDSEDADTFAFKQFKTVPGGFGRQPIFDDESDTNGVAVVGADQNMEEDDLSERSAPYSEDESSDDEPSMAGAYPSAPIMDISSPNKPILKAPGTPGRPLLDLEGDWADQLQQTISPRKQNRDLLRETQNKVLLDRAYSPIKPSATQKAFRTSVDVMSSIFGKYEEDRMKASNRASTSKQRNDSMELEFPIAKRTKPADKKEDDLTDRQREWLSSLEEHFRGMGTFVSEQETIQPINDRHEMFFDLQAMLSLTVIVDENGIPNARHDSLPFSYIIEELGKSSIINVGQHEKDFYALAHVLLDEFEDHYTLDLPASETVRFMPLVKRDRLSNFLSSYILRVHGEKILSVEKENPTAAALLKLSAHDIKGACDSLERAKNYKLMLLVSQLENASASWQEEIRAQINAWRDQGALSEISDDVRAIYEICGGNVTICQGKSSGNVPVEDKAKTFAISEEYGLDWIQCFALGFWYGFEEKTASTDECVRIEAAVHAFQQRVYRGEESVKPDGDIMWVLLTIYAATKSDQTKMPTLPQALEVLDTNWDVSPSFCMHHAIVAAVNKVSVDKSQEDKLAAKLAWQLSSNNDLAGALYALLHLTDSSVRVAMMKALLNLYAATLPDVPPAADDPNRGSELNTESDELWILLTERLLVPKSLLFTAKALHARATDSSGHSELTYLILAGSWKEAHECLTRRVAPGCIIDADYDALSDFIQLFATDNRVEDWALGGGIYADFVQLIKMNDSAKKDLEAEEKLIGSIAARLIAWSKDIAIKDGDLGVDLGQLPVEELEQRVALKEMSRLVAEKMGDNLKEILQLPITSDQRLKYTSALAVEHYRGVMMSGTV